MKYRFKNHPSKLATLMITFGAGGRVVYQNKYPAGIAHFMEHMRFKGTLNYSAKDLLKKIADAGGSWNAYTSEDIVSYYVSIPEDNLEVAFDCLSEIIFNPVFPEDEIEKEKEVVCQEIRMYLDDLDNLVQKKLRKLVFNNSMSNPIEGTEESVRLITKNHLTDFNSEFYNKDNMLISLAAPQNYPYLLLKYFGEHNNIFNIKEKDKNVLYNRSKYAEVFKKNQLQDSILIAFGSNQAENYLNQNKGIYSVFNSIFGASDTSRLFMSVREDLGLVYGIHSGADYNLDGTLYQIFTSTENENRQKVIEEINKQINIMVETKPTQEELNRAKNQIKSHVYSRQDTSSGSISDILSEEIYGQIIGKEFLNRVEQVTAEDIHNISREIFSGNRYESIGTGKE